MTINLGERFMFTSSPKKRFISILRPRNRSDSVRQQSGSCRCRISPVEPFYRHALGHLKRQFILLSRNFKERYARRVIIQRF